MPGPRRPPHSKAHPVCPFGQTSWAECDKAAEHQWGQCKAVVGDREPTPCSRWAAAETGGYCNQHFVARIDDDKRREREAIRQAELNARIDAYIAMTTECPSMFDCPHDGAHPKLPTPTQAESTRGLAGVRRVAAGEPPRTGKRRPHRIG